MHYQHWMLYILALSYQAFLLIVESEEIALDQHIISAFFLFEHEKCRDQVAGTDLTNEAVMEEQLCLYKNIHPRIRHNHEVRTYLIKPVILRCNYNTPSVLQYRGKSFTQPIP